MISIAIISYRCSIATESLSLTIFKIMGILYIWTQIYKMPIILKMTFLRHVTSSVV